MKYNTCMQMPQRKKTLSSIVGWVLVILFVVGTGAVWWHRQAISDWMILRDYRPSPTVMRLSRDTAMTPYAQKLFYINNPQILSGKPFTTQCPLAAEKTVILGCYRGKDRGIFLHTVTDERLHGVVEVTAAHEMLHAAYDRLSGAAKKRIDTLLVAYYERGLTDERVKDTLEAYKKSEPHQLPNEMHSIFGTEVATLPAELETYYQTYFLNRNAVTNLMRSYQAEFTSRRDQVERYDAELSTLKTSIETCEQQLAYQKNTLEARASQMSRLRSEGNTAAYNSQVSGYNQAVEEYNQLLESGRGLIERYNTLVEKRNTLALEERQLTQALSAGPLPLE